MCSATAARSRRAPAGPADPELSDLSNDIANDEDPLEAVVADTTGPRREGADASDEENDLDPLRNNFDVDTIDIGADEDGNGDLELSSND